MRSISSLIAKSFIARKPKRQRNTWTDGTTLYLHGNAIAWHENGGIAMTLAGWPTVTTRDRLNTLCLLAFDMKPWHQKDHTQYFNDDAIDSRAVITMHPVITVDAADFFADAA